MLFQSFYNWIRYKNNPPSFFFKNRLFIERDNQSPRIFSQFGQTFRSSKWNTITNFGVKFHFKSYKWIFFIVLLFLILNSNIAVSPIFNFISFIFWLNVDAFDYYLSFLIWFFFFFFSFCYNNVYLYFFYNNFSSFRDKPTFSYFANSAMKPKNGTKSAIVHNTSLSKTSLNWILYTWVNQSNTSTTFSLITEKLFKSNNLNNQNFWTLNYNYFNKLYRLTFFQNLISLNAVSSKLNLQNLLTPFLNNNNYALVNLSTLKFDNRFIVLYFWYFLNLSNSTFTKKNETFSLISSYTIKNFFWLSDMPVSEQFLLKNKFGLFINTSSNFAQINHLTNLWPILQTTQNALSKSITIGKLNRWLFKYFVINRKLFKNSHKWTHLKNTFSSSFINPSYFNRNLWNSHFFNDNRSFKSLLSWNYFTNSSSRTNLNNELFYLNTLQYGFEQNSLIFQKFAFIEKSYFWLAKRAFFMNALPSNNIFSENRLIPNPTSFYTTKINDLLLTRNAYLFFFLDTTASIAETTHKTKILQTILQNISKTPNSSYNQQTTKDLYPVFNINEKFSVTDLKNLNAINNFELTNDLVFYLNPLSSSFLTPSYIKQCKFFYQTSGLKTTKHKTFKKILFFQNTPFNEVFSHKNFVITLQNYFK